MKLFIRVMTLMVAVAFVSQAAPIFAKNTAGEDAKVEKHFKSYSQYKEAYEAGNKALAARQWDEAVDAYDQAAKLAGIKTVQAKSANAKGWVLLTARRLPQAQAAFQEAVNYDPSNKLALSNLAYVSFRMYEAGIAGKEALDKAAEVLETCKNLDETYKSDLREQVKAAIGREEMYAKAVAPSETPRSGMGYKAAAALGDVAQSQGQFDLALKAFAIAEKDANSPVAKGSAANRSGKALLDGRRPKEALAHFERAVNFQPKEKVFLNNLGNAYWVLYDSGQGNAEDLKKSVELFDKVNAIDPSYRAENLKMALEELRNVDPSAAEAYSKEEVEDGAGDEKGE